MKATTANNVIKLLEGLEIKAHQTSVPDGSVLIDLEDANKVVDGDFAELLNLIKSECGTGFHWTQRDAVHLHLGNIY